MYELLSLHIWLPKDLRFVEDFQLYLIYDYFFKIIFIICVSWSLKGRVTLIWVDYKLHVVLLPSFKMAAIYYRQKRWLGRILRHDSLLRITLERQIQGKKAYGRPRTMLLDWLLKTEEGNISYEVLKMSTQDRSRWSQWRCKLAIWQNTAEIFYTYTTK